MSIEKKSRGMSAVFGMFAAAALVTVLAATATPAAATTSQGGWSNAGWSSSDRGWSKWSTSKEEKSRNEFSFKSNSDNEKFIQIVKPGYHFEEEAKGKGWGKKHKQGHTTPVAPIPLPAAAWLLVAGMAGLGAVGRKRAAK